MSAGMVKVRTVAADARTRTRSGRRTFPRRRHLPDPKGGTTDPLLRSQYARAKQRRAAGATGRSTANAGRRSFSDHPGSESPTSEPHIYLGGAVVVAESSGESQESNHAKRPVGPFRPSPGNVSRPARATKTCQKGPLNDLTRPRLSSHRGATTDCVVVLDNFRSEKLGARLSLNEHKTACFVDISG